MENFTFLYLRKNKITIPKSPFSIAQKYYTCVIGNRELFYLETNTFRALVEIILGYKDKIEVHFFNPKNNDCRAPRDITIRIEVSKRVPLWVPMKTNFTSNFKFYEKFSNVFCRLYMFFVESRVEYGENNHFHGKFNFQDQKLNFSKNNFHQNIFEGVINCCSCQVGLASKRFFFNVSSSRLHTETRA